MNRSQIATEFLALYHHMIYFNYYIPDRVFCLGYKCDRDILVSENLDNIENKMIKI